MDSDTLLYPTTSRRTFLRQGGTLFAAGVLGSAGMTVGCSGAVQYLSPTVRFGVMTDLHYAEKDPVAGRVYRDSLMKTAEAVEFFRQTGIAFVVELGDFIDAADTVEAELRYLEAIQREFAAYTGDRHYVLGNHCVATLSKPAFLETVGTAEKYYSFDQGPFHFVVLDACFREDGVEYDAGNFHWQDTAIPDEELEWLRADLKAAQGLVYVFAHQRLDVSEKHSVKNHARVRSVLEESGKVVAVFQGHNHVNEYQDIGGIHYITLNAVVDGPGLENNAYAVVDIYPDGALFIDGFATQLDYRLECHHAPATG